MASPFRHATLMAKVMESEKYPVLLKMTDGGTDQRNTLQSVRCANITLFKEFDLDMLIHVRCAPGQSWINPAECIMSILNIGLQNVSLEREELIDKTKEAAVRRCGSMAEIRELGSKVKEGWTVAVEPLQRIIKNRFCRLKLKDEAITVYDPVTDEQMDLMKRHLRELFPELKLDKLQKVHTDKVQSYKGWIEKHCKISHYSFQIRKCTDEKCCLPTVLPREKLSWLPDPVLDDSKEHFKKYCDVNGTETTDSDRPSLKVAKKKTEKQPKAKPISEEFIDKESSVVEEQETVKEDYIKLPDSDPQLCTTQRSRSLVTCVECRKPRIVYAKNKLTERQTMAFVTAIEGHKEQNLKTTPIPMPPLGKSRERECQKCIMHGVHIKVKGHKFNCYYRDCQCKRCQMVSMKRQKNKLVIAQKRRLEMNKEKNFPIEAERETSDSSDLEIDMTACENDEESISTILSNRRAVYCRRCQVHGVQSLLRGHKDKCAFKGCWCAECRIIVQSVQGSQFGLCSQCGYYPPGLSVPYVHPYPRPLYGMPPPLLLQQQSFTSTGVNTELSNSHSSYQPQVNYFQTQQGNLTQTYESSMGYSNSRPREGLQSILRNRQQETQTSQSIIQNCLQQETQTSESVIRNCLQQGCEISPATLQL